VDVGALGGDAAAVTAASPKLSLLIRPAARTVRRQDRRPRRRVFGSADTDREQCSESGPCHSSSRQLCRRSIGHARRALAAIGRRGILQPILRPRCPEGTGDTPAYLLSGLGWGSRLSRPAECGLGSPGGGRSRRTVLTERSPGRLPEPPGCRSRCVVGKTAQSRRVAEPPGCRSRCVVGKTAQSRRVAEFGGANPPEAVVGSTAIDGFELSRIARIPARD